MSELGTLSAAPSAKEPRGFRVMLALGGAIYLAWWFAVEALLPGAFNPLPGRLAIVAYFFVMFALTYVSDAVKRRAEQLFYFGALALVGHYFYLFHHNARDINWAVGAYIVVFALCVGVQSRAWLYVFALFSFACGLLVFVLDPTLQKTIFLPGLATRRAPYRVIEFARAVRAQHALNVRAIVPPYLERSHRCGSAAGSGSGFRGAARARCGGASRHAYHAPSRPPLPPENRTAGADP